MTGRPLVPHFVLQFAVGAILMLSLMIWRRTTGKPLIAGVTLSACLVMFSLFVMRWNVVIGGQEISTTGKGLLSYHLSLLGREGALVAILVGLAPLAVLVAKVKLFPPWDRHAPRAAPDAD